MMEPIPSDEAGLIERIAALERVKSAAAAAQARAAAAFDAARRSAEAVAGVPAARHGRGVAAEIALARRDSPARGGRHLGFARALVDEMPHTLAALEAGMLSEWRATLIVRESACLDVDDRRTLDAEMCDPPSRLDGLGDARIAATAKAIAYRLDPHAVVDRAAKAETERTVTIRPAPDTMTYVTALLPVAQGVSVYAALRRAADTAGGPRTRGQVMADTLVERVTGRSAATPTPIAVNSFSPTARYSATAPHPRISLTTGLFRPTSPAVWCRPPSVMRGRARRCGVCTLTHAPARWSPWSHARGSSRRGWPPSSVCATIDVVRRIAMHRFGIATMRRLMPTEVRQRPPTASGCANSAITSKKRPAGMSGRERTNPARTQQNSSPRLVDVTGRWRHRSHPSSRSASSRPGSGSRLSATPPDSAQQAADDSVGE